MTRNSIRNLDVYKKEIQEITNKMLNDIYDLIDSLNKSIDNILYMSNQLYGGMDNLRKTISEASEYFGVSEAELIRRSVKLYVLLKGYTEKKKAKVCIYDENNNLVEVIEDLL